MNSQQSIDRAIARRYTRIFRREEDGGYSAEVLELPGAFGAGDSIDEANDSLETAMRLWIETELDAGKDIPEPLDVESYSGRLTARIPPSLHERAHIQSQLEGVSLNRLLSAAIAAYVGHPEQQTKPRKAVGRAD